jgi:hypothetical protein
MISINRLDGPHSQPDDEEPPQAEIDAWCANMVRVMKDGGVWGIPRSELVFKFDQPNKTMLLVSGNPMHPDFYATQKAFARVGWSVVAQKPEEPT